MAKAKKHTGPQEQLSVTWCDDGMPADLVAAKGELKTAVYKLKVTGEDGRAAKAADFSFSRVRQKALITYEHERMEPLTAGVVKITFTYRTDRIYAEEDDVKVRVRISADGYRDGISPPAAYKERVLDAPNP